MGDWTFRDPAFLAAALLAPAVTYLWTRRVPSTVAFSSTKLTQGLPRTWRQRLAALPGWLLGLSVVLLAIALAGPRRADAQHRVRRQGIAIAMVVDRSSSMNARDLVPTDRSVNRLDVVKQLFERFVLGSDERAGRTDDAVGLIAFARFADGLCPLTLDHGNLVSIVRDLAIVEQPQEDGTAVGEGLALAVERLRKVDARSRVVILLTDGSNNAGEIEPRQAAELAKVHGIKAYCIGAGTRGLAPVPVINRFTGQTHLRPRRVDLDEKTLQQIADITGGRYFRATNASGLASVYDEIDRMERTEIEEVRYLQYREGFALFAGLGLLLLAMGTLLQGTLFRRLP